MDYENRTIPEGINVTDEHPLKEFFILAFGLGLATVLVVIILSVTAGKLAHLIPFSIEKKIAISAFSTDPPDNSPLNEEQLIIENYLQNLANQLVIAQQIPEEMNITVHYVDGDTVNAFATLGGNIIMYRGLIEKLPNENTLSMLLSHEIAHIKHRDPIISLGRGVTIGLVLASITGFGESGIPQKLVGNIGLLTSLTFSRSQEKQADLEALQTLQRYYGHIKGAEELFEILQTSNKGLDPPELLSTHPVTKDRIEMVRNYSGSPFNNSSMVALPEFITSLNNVSDKKKKRGRIDLTLKAELIHKKRYMNPEDAKQDIFEYIEVFYNQKQRHSYLGYKAPLEHEELNSR